MNQWEVYQDLVNKYNSGSLTPVPSVNPNWVPPKITPPGGPGGGAPGGAGAGALIGTGLGGYGAYNLLGGGGSAAAAIPATPSIISATAIPQASGATMAMPAPNIFDMSLAQAVNTPVTTGLSNVGSLGSTASSAGNAWASGLGGLEGAGGAASAAQPATSTLGAIAPYAGLAGAGLGAYGLYNALDSGDEKSGALSGLALGGGLAAASPLLLGGGPVGWGVLGLSALAGGLGGYGLTSMFGSKNRWKEEQDRVSKLAEKGITGWKELQATYPKLSKGRSIGELVAIEEANKAAGKHNNVDFARTRDIKYLKPEDIWGYSTFGEKFGNDWLGKYTEGQRRGIAQQLLDAGAVTEGRGQIKVDWDKYKPLIADALKGGAVTPKVSVAPVLPGVASPIQAPVVAPAVTERPGFRSSYLTAREKDILKSKYGNRYNVKTIDPGVLTQILSPIGRTDAGVKRLDEFKTALKASTQPPK